MKRSLFAIAACLSLAGCGYYPSASDLVHITDTPAAIRACKNLGEVSGPFRTTPGDLWGLAAPMREKVVALGGNFLLLERVGNDWGVARATAYSCKSNSHIGW